MSPRCPRCQYWNGWKTVRTHGSKQNEQVTTSGVVTCSLMAHVQGRKLRTLTQPLPEGEERKVILIYSPRRRGLRGRVRSCVGVTWFGFTVGEGCGGVAPCGHNQISMKSESR